MAKEINVGLVGLGTIGLGLVRVLRENAGEISARTGAKVVLKRACDIDITSERDVSLAGIELTDKFSDLLGDDIDIVVELIGGYDPARDFVTRALDAGKHVVTANKAIVAKYGEELFAKAAEKGVSLRFEAAVAGGIPIIRALQESLASDRIDELYGIINGTANFILTEMAEKGSDFSDVLGEAQRIGYAEADPTFDIEGIDAAHKLTILARLAFGLRLDMENVPHSGITQLEPLDFKMAENYDCVIKLLGIAKRHEDGRFELHVEPVMIPRTWPLATVSGAMNAIFVKGAALGPAMFYGAGAGRMPTASAVAADVVDIARHLLEGVTSSIPMQGFIDDGRTEAELVPDGEIVSEYYLRIFCKDRPGVLERVTGALGRAEISISALLQEERHETEAVPVVMMLHECTGAALEQALTEINGMTDIIEPPAFAMRVEST